MDQNGSLLYHSNLDLFNQLNIEKIFNNNNNNATIVETKLLQFNYYLLVITIIVMATTNDNNNNNNIKSNENFHTHKHFDFSHHHHFFYHSILLLFYLSNFFFVQKYFINFLGQMRHTHTLILTSLCLLLKTKLQFVFFSFKVTGLYSVNQFEFFKNFQRILLSTNLEVK